MKLFLVEQAAARYSSYNISAIVQAENEQQALERYHVWFADTRRRDIDYYDAEVKPFEVYEGMVVEVGGHE